MNPSGEYKGQQYEYGWNVDGWPGSEMSTYANGDFYNKLPEELRKVIKATKVISGHGSADTSDFTSTNKIYLLSAHEVYEDGTSNKISTSDTAYNQTRQLDYYKTLGVTTNNYFGAIKREDSVSTFDWWLRAAISDNDYVFLNVMSNGAWDATITKASNGFAPAFRIGKKCKLYVKQKIEIKQE